MKSIVWKIFCAGTALLLLSPGAWAAESASKAIDPQALGVLKRMSERLAAAKAFTYQSRAVLEVPAKNGQFLTLVSRGDVELKRPDKIRARFNGEAPHFDFFYDGVTATAFAPSTNVFSRSKAPATIDAMLPALEEETGIRFASAGLLFSNPYEVMTRGLTSAILVGRTTVLGAACDHLAFQAPGINWEIWIESGPQALPRRLAVTNTLRPGFPRVLVEFSAWNLRPWLRPSTFVFHPPADSREIPFATLIKP